MGTVHSLAEYAADPVRLRRRFDLALPNVGCAGGTSREPLSPVLVFGGIFFLPGQLAGQAADEAFRDVSMFWLSLFRQQLRFYCLIP